MNSVKRAKRLIAFDFDQTIVDDNTDFVIRNLIDATLITDDIKILYKTNGWTSYMHAIFAVLHQNGINEAAIKEAIAKIPPVSGILKCIQTLFENNFDIIIISDSNSEFISYWNTRNGISKFISQTYTNPAIFNKNGTLELKPFHYQTECKLSSENLCKGKILEDFIYAKNVDENKTNYKNVFFVGDGKNDICAMLRLKETDFACPRKEYYCDKNLNNIDKNQLKASIIRWENGDELLQNIINFIEQENDE